MELGGHSNSATLNGVRWEPHGPHIFHTSDPEIASLVRALGMTRPFAQQSLTNVFLRDDDSEPVLLSWPPQLEELRQLPIWSEIESELAVLPAVPVPDNFETYSISIMGPTLYGIFIRGYTIKQWGRSPDQLLSTFAPSRFELRRDGNRRLFRDTWEFFDGRGAKPLVEKMTVGVPVTLGRIVRFDDLPELSRDFDAFIVTAALDDFVGKAGELEWRGVRTVAEYSPLDDADGKLTSGYLVNQPSMRFDYTRTVETKHASGQRINGTVVSKEYPGSDARHYPVPTADRRFEKRNDELQAHIRAIAPRPVFFCGRLANYTYINQDRAIRQGMDTAMAVRRALEE